MITIADEGLLRLIRLERPEKANALTAPMLAAIAEAVEAAAKDGMRALILTGAGKVFSAGADLDAIKAGLGGDLVWNRVADAIADFPGLTIAALNGTLAGGGFAMALACDLRIAVPGANFFYPVMRLNNMPRPGDPQRLEALVGPGRARLLLMAGARIGAEEALSWGLIERICPAEDLLDTARALCVDALGAGDGHAAAIKAAFR